MSEPEKFLREFLQRWSRRKREATAAHDETNEEHSAQTQGPRGGPDISADSIACPAPAFDIANLPPIESITALSDIRVFLAPGVPLDLSRAALRRAWATDPAIRDFVGIAENQWDFVVPDGVPGFGALDLTADLRRLITELCGESVEVGDTKAAAKASEYRPDETAHSSCEPQQQEQGGNKDSEPQSELKSEPAVIGDPPPQAARRKHGGALPT